MSETTDLSLVSTHDLVGELRKRFAGRGVVALMGRLDQPRHRHDGSAPRLVYPTKYGREMNPTAYIVQPFADARPFRPALVLGQGLPKEVGGQPASYAWKEMLLPGTYKDGKGKEFAVDGQRIDNLIANFKRAAAKGFKPFLPPAHDVRRGDANFGYVLELRRNDRGALEGLHQLIGPDAIAAAARNGTSICTLRDVTDEHGEFYDELIDHNAIIPDPRLSGLTDFQPAIAASRGQAVESVVLLELAAPQPRSPEMDLTKLREVLGAAKEIPDDQIITQAVAKLGESKTALETANADKTTALSRATTAENKVLELSRTQTPAVPDEHTLLLLGRSLETEFNSAIASGGISPDTAKELRALLVPEGKPSALSLSRLAGSTDPLAFRLLGILAHNKAVPLGEKTGMQLSRQVPGEGEQDEATKAAAAGHAQGKAYADARIAAMSR